MVKNRILYLSWLKWKPKLLISMKILHFSMIRLYLMSLDLKKRKWYDSENENDNFLQAWAKLLAFQECPIRIFWLANHTPFIFRDCFRTFSPWFDIFCLSLSLSYRSECSLSFMFNWIFLERDVERWHCFPRASFQRGRQRIKQFKNMIKLVRREALIFPSDFIRQHARPQWESLIESFS